MALTVRAGVNLPQMALDELFGRAPVPGIQPFQEIGMVRTFHEAYVSPQEMQDLEERAAAFHKAEPAAVDLAEVC